MKPPNHGKRVRIRSRHSRFTATGWLVLTPEAVWRERGYEKPHLGVVEPGLRRPVPVLEGDRIEVLP